MQCSRLVSAAGSSKLLPSLQCSRLVSKLLVSLIVLLILESISDSSPELGQQLGAPAVIFTGFDVISPTKSAEILAAWLLLDLSCKGLLFSKIHRKCNK